MANDQEDDSNDNLNMSHEQLMELLNHVAEQRNLPVASSPYQSAPQQAPAQPKPQAAPIPANVPQSGKVLDQASGAWIRPDTAESVAKFRQQGDQLQQQDEEKTKQEAQQQSSQPQNQWQQMYAKLKQQNPRATPQELLMTMKAFKEAGAFEGQTNGQTFDQRMRLLETRDADSMARLEKHPEMVGAGEDAKNKSDISAAAPKKAGETAGAESTKITQTINDQADVATMSNLQLKHISDLSKDIKMGKMAGANQLASSWAQAWGLMDQKQADATFGSAGSSQALTKAVLPLVSQMTKSLTSRPAVFEFQQFLKSNPNIEQTPDGFEKVVSFMTRLNELAIDKQKYFREWKKTHDIGDYQDFSSDWNQKVIAESGDKTPATQDEGSESAPQAKVINYSDWK